MCDSFTATGVATVDGIVRFAKNSDRESDEPQYLERVAAADHPRDSSLELTHRRIPQVPHTHAVLLSKARWMWGAEIGANEHGLVIGNEAVFSGIPASLDTGILGMDFVRLGLERAASVDEAIVVITGLLRRHGQGGNGGFKRRMAYHNSYLLADGRSAGILETVDRDWVTRSVTDFDAISNAITTEGFGHAEGDETKTASAVHRRGRARYLLGSGYGTLGTSDFFNILRDHEEPLASSPAAGARVCAHARNRALGQTTASWVSVLSRRHCVHWVTATAAPCTGVFKPVLLEWRLPQHGPPPADENDHVSLWWAHEQLRAHLESHESMREQFEAERDVLESRFLHLIEQRIPGAETAELTQNLIQQCWDEALAFERRWLAA